jgi:hypothetical protein
MDTKNICANLLRVWDYPFKSQIRSKLRYVNPFLKSPVATILNEGAHDVKPEYWLESEQRQRLRVGFFFTTLYDFAR